MIRRPPRSTLDRSSAASDVYKRQDVYGDIPFSEALSAESGILLPKYDRQEDVYTGILLSLIHISEPTRPY